MIAALTVAAIVLCVVGTVINIRQWRLNRRLEQRIDRLSADAYADLIALAYAEQVMKDAVVHMQEVHAKQMIAEAKAEEWRLMFELEAQS